MSALDWQPDLHSASYQEDPAPTLRRLRSEDPVHRSRHGYWFLTRYGDVKAALRDRRFSSAWAKQRASKAVIPARAGESDGDRRNRELILSSFNMRDGEEHARVRTLVNKAFSRAAMEARRERIEALAEALLPVPGKGAELDLVSGFGFPLPFSVAAEMIGVPDDERLAFRRSFEEAELLGLPDRTDEQHARGLAALDWQVAFIRELAEARRRSPEPDLISELVRAEEDGDRLTSDETISAVVTIFTAAGTTTERFLSSGLLLLLQHPEQWRRLAEDRTILPGAIEEILRFHHPDQSTTTPRFVTEDLEVGGVKLARGDRVRFGLGAANRDPEEFSDPETFDVTRTPNRHLSFGRGSHFCLGANLARLVGTVAFGAFLERYREVELLTKDPRRDPRRRDRYEEIRVRVR